ncbi:MAG: type II toxin-antitoxin system prevent-host-death family antitoxin [Anaerolineae bacterium]|nr:MAG: type II toxin-antitoxin system prevent-host-death family antitoxin [Anaerolineae bacterium]
MERVVSATEARVRFGEMMQRVVINQETIIVERSGEPQIVLLSLAKYYRLKAADQGHVDWRKRVDQARVEIARDLKGAELTPPEEIIIRMREERDARLMDMR